MGWADLATWLSNNWSSLTEAIAAASVASFTGILLWIEYHRDRGDLEIREAKFVGSGPRIGYELVIVNRGRGPEGIAAAWALVTLKRSGEEAKEGRAHISGAVTKLRMSVVREDGDFGGIPPAGRARYFFGFADSSPPGAIRESATLLLEPVVNRHRLVSFHMRAT